MGLSGIPGVQGLGGIVPGAAAPAEPEWLEFEVTTTAANQTYSWQITTGNDVNATTQWGDGTTQTHTEPGVFTKTYAAAGTYTVRIKMSFTSFGRFNLRPGTDRTRLTGLLSPIPAFPNLIGIPSICNGCTGLVGATPSGFLRYVDVDFMASMFLNCSGLRVQSDIFGPDTNKFLDRSPDFTNAFRGVGTAVGSPQTAPAIWAYNYGSGVPTSLNTFLLSTNLSNWAQIPAAWGGPA